MEIINFIELKHPLSVRVRLVIGERGEKEACTQNLAQNIMAVTCSYGNKMWWYFGEKEPPFLYFCGMTQKWFEFIFTHFPRNHCILRSFHVFTY